MNSRTEQNPKNGSKAKRNKTSVCFSVSDKRTSLSLFSPFPVFSLKQIKTSSPKKKKPQPNEDSSCRYSRHPGSPCPQHGPGLRCRLRCPCHSRLPQRDRLVHQDALRLRQRGARRPQRRCDGVEDCADGTDEYMCDAAHFHHSKPVTDMTVAERTALTEVSCIKCTCSKGQISIASANAAGSRSRSSPPATAPCSPTRPASRTSPATPPAPPTSCSTSTRSRTRAAAAGSAASARSGAPSAPLALPRPTAGLKRLTRDEYFKKFVVCFLFSLKRMTKLIQKNPH